jgi:hypothetical protein
MKFQGTNAIVGSHECNRTVGRTERHIKQETQYTSVDCDTRHGHYGEDILLPRSDVQLIT